MQLKELIISETLTIRELSVNELERAFSIVSQLRPHLTIEKYIEIVTDMKNSGYQIICLFECGEIVSYAGFAKLNNLYYGNHIWIYELVTDSDRRSKGYGKLLLSNIEKYAKDNDLNCVALSSGLQRENAHKFYDTADYETRKSILTYSLKHT